tara:strand:- start:151 stop:861 length:711 start_codon:yes stop_codon:yes gene_type:complete
MRSGKFGFLGSFDAAAPAGDPYWANVVSLLEFDGADGSTIITDAKGKIWTAHGNAKISTARKVGGVSSLLLDGAGDYISTPYHADFDFGTDDFTIEWYQYLNLLSPFSPFDFRGGVANSPRPMLYNTFSSPGTDLFYYLNGANRISAPSGTLVTAAFQHCALCRVSGVTRLFVGGVQRGASYVDTTNYTNAGVFIGRNTATTDRDFNGNFDGWRATNGVGRYVDPFTPPTLPYAQG